MADPAGSYTISPFEIETSTLCTSADIVYTMSTLPNVSFVTFDNSTLTVSWETPTGPAGDYTI